MLYAPQVIISEFSFTIDRLLGLLLSNNGSLIFELRADELKGTTTMFAFAGLRGGLQRDSDVPIDC